VGVSYKLKSFPFPWYHKKLVLCQPIKIKTTGDALLRRCTVSVLSVPNTRMGVAHELQDRRMTLSAFVRLREGVAETSAHTKLLQDFVKSKLLPYKYPRSVSFVEDLPKTGTGKIDRQALLVAVAGKLGGH
jgi:acyl-CoA synthetase (AMP-forming)/AMP-acid ligase II